MNERTRRYKQTLGDWLAAYADWDLWATLTYRHEVQNGLAAQHLKAWLRFAARDCLGTHVLFAWASDPQQRGVLHYHVLLARLDKRPATVLATACAELDEAWQRTGRACGNTEIRLYDPSRRAAQYQSWHAEWDINVACPREPRCRRSSGCRLAPGSWS